MSKIKKLRNQRLKADAESIIESGKVRVDIFSHRVEVQVQGGDEFTLDYGSLIELYKILQDLYESEVTGE